ncbi:ArsR/SmtB family transcription factor [Cohaesibacter intestini]|uniref:ArsR/SmtB family transcription factor n=1 Tax=Cohaesibacter intestini TaxID=2211145 RepID=UPI001FE16ABA|nr:metalloregulator ArsR/SmtB family transcription factor [Cohaesibacter intestini]
MAERQRQATKTANEAAQTDLVDQARLEADCREENALVAQQQALMILSALGQETRLKAFRLLSVAGDEGIGAGGLAKHLGTPHNTLSTHLAILSRAGLITSERSGRNITYRIVPESLSNLLLFLLDDCCNAMPEACMPKSLLESLRLGAGSSA